MSLMKLARVLRSPYRSFVYLVRDWADARVLKWRHAEWEASPVTPTGEPGRSQGCDAGCDYCGYICRCGRAL